MARDDALEARLSYAFHTQFGYLTACPTNVGTGIRVSVMLHLPALVITRQIDKVFRSLHKISLAVRGLYGEGSQAMGDFYQISNQTTLGKTEEELVQQVADVVPVLIDYERRAREFLVRETQQNVHDQVSRAFGVLRTAQTISAEETMQLLSRVRMGVLLGLLGDVKITDINSLLVRTQPAHLQKIRGVELDTVGSFGGGLVARPEALIPQYDVVFTSAMSAIEAMACGLPVLCSNSSSLPEVVADAALLLDPNQLV